MHKQIGKVTSVRVGTEDHGFMTVYLQFDYGGSGQGFGGHILCNFDRQLNRRVGTAAGLDYIMQLAKALDVNDLHDAKGRTYWVLREDEGFNAGIVGVQQLEPDGKGMFLVSDWRRHWFPEVSR